MPIEKVIKKTKIREYFLTSFVKALILNSITEKEVEEIKIEKEKFKQSIKNVQQKQMQMKPSMLRSLKPLPVSAPAYQPIQLKPGQQRETITLGKITQLLADPSVLSIECPGTGKNVLVNRSGLVQTSGIVLSEQEIDSVIQEFSNKTRIPFGIGVFKAAFQDLIMTAVLSEYVGTRFIILKKNPFG